MSSARRLLLAQADAAHLGDRVDAVGEEVATPALVREAERVTHGDARLLHRDVDASAGNPIDVARRVDARHRGAEVARRPGRSRAGRPGRRPRRARARPCCPDGRPPPAPTPRRWPRPTTSVHVRPRAGRARRARACAPDATLHARATASRSASRSPISASRKGSRPGARVDEVHLARRAPRTCTRTRSRSRRRR